MTQSVETPLPPIFGQRVKKLKPFVEPFWLRNYGSRAGMFLTSTVESMVQLLGGYGIGSETADAIPLMAPHFTAGVWLP